MNFYLIGVDYKSAPPEIRQKLYLRRRQIEHFWNSIVALDTAILVTCNRFDVSISARTEKEIIANLGLFKKEFPEFYAHSYIKQTTYEVLRYGLRLACGFESQLKGEFQILEQLQLWLKQDKFPESLFEFWSEITKLASEIRVKSGLNSNEINIARLLFEDLKDIETDNGKLKIAVVGTGKVAGLLLECKPDNVQFLFVAHKNRLKAEFLASQVGAQVLSFDQFKEVLPKMHVLVSAASSPHIILRSEDIPDSVSRRDKPLYIYDLGFPMNVAKDLGYRKNIILKNLDDLVLPAENTNNYLQVNFNLAEYLIEEMINCHSEGALLGATEESILKRDSSSPRNRRGSSE